jgi:hypothetical protein
VQPAARSVFSARQCNPLLPFRVSIFSFFIVCRLL